MCPPRVGGIVGIAPNHRPPDVEDDMTDTLLARSQSGSATQPTTRRFATIAVALSVLDLIVLLIHNTNDGPVWRVSLIVGVTVAVLTAIVFGVVTRRTLAKQSAKSSTRAALVLGVLAVLSIVAFWMAVPPIFGVAAVALAVDARDRRPFRHDWVATLAGVLGVVGTAAGLVLAIAS
jgi:F0F1-type ATP synthase assembly protein I